MTERKIKMSLLNKKVKVIIIACLVIALGLNFFTINNRYILIVGIVALVLVLFGLFDEKKEEDTEKEEDSNVASDEEMEETLLGDGEYSYDDYDKVCCEKCGAYMGEGVDVCPSCGHVKSGSETAKKQKVCPNCGRPIEDDLDFCTYCDYEFKK